MIKWLLVNNKLSDLMENPHNPRVLTKDQSKHLKYSLERFGIADKPIVNLDGLIIGGHQRIKILKELGYETIECWMPDNLLTQKDVDELCIRLNKNSGEWDWDLLANEWDEDDLSDWGFTDNELCKFVEEIEEEDKKYQEQEKKKSACPSCGYEF